MAKVIFIGGMRGAGKTKILNEFRKIKKKKLVNLISEFGANWKTTQVKVGKKIRNMALKEEKIIIDLHYGAPKNNLIKERPKQNINFSRKFKKTLTKIMIKNMGDKEIKFYFFYIDVKTEIIMKRLKGSKRLSKNFVRNIKRIKRLDKKAFIETFNTCKNMGLNVNKEIIKNNKDLGKTIKNLEKEIWK